MGYLNQEEKEIAEKFVSELFEPAYRYSRNTSYGIKHIFERATGIYMTNDEMKYIMLELGYKPNDRTELNPRYKARFKRL